jgi:ariadne-1
MWLLIVFERLSSRITFWNTSNFFLCLFVFPLFVSWVISDDCWTAFLNSQLQGGRSCINATCMGMRCTKDHAHKFGCSCNELVPSSFFYYYVENKELINKYVRWILNSFVEGQKSIKWCPKPGCEYAVNYSGGGDKGISCKCGHLFCYSVSRNSHNQRGRVTDY